MLAEKSAIRRVRLERDGTVTIVTGKVELGQGILTALAQIAAEELDVPLERVRILPPSTAYSPDEGVTSGSLSIQDGGSSLRKACAELRGAPPKQAAAYRVVGTSARRIELPAKIAGKPSYVQDMTLPGMLFGRVVRPPRPFKKLKQVGKVDLRRASLVRDGSFLGVLAEREEDAVAAATRLRDKSAWELAPDVPADFHGWLKQHVAERNIAKEKLDAPAKARSAMRVQAAYAKPFIAHASIGPSCAVARLQGAKLEVWTHSQGIFGLRQELAKILGMDEKDIVVTHAEGAGCYGHNGADDAALDAALLARAAAGRPVKLQWTRGDEFAWEPCGAAMCFELEAHLDADGSIVSWRHDLWSNGHTHRPGRLDRPTLTAAAHLEKPFELASAVDPALPAGGAQRNAIPLYDFPDLRVTHHYVREMPVRSSSLRSLGGFGNVFAIESFMDECALAASTDPVSFRLKHLQDARAREVIQKVVEESRWNSWKPAEGRGHGIGFAKYKNLGAYCAIVAEVEAGRELRVTRLVAAVDVGIAVNPDGVVNQIEGGCIQAASWTLKEEMRPEVQTWEDYPILKFSEAPPVEVHLLRNECPAVGAGECAMGPTAAAIANALCNALGVRVRDLPLTPERIVKVMA